MNLAMQVQRQHHTDDEITETSDIANSKASALGDKWSLQRTKVVAVRQLDSRLLQMVMYASLDEVFTFTIFGSLFEILQAIMKQGFADIFGSVGNAMGIKRKGDPLNASKTDGEKTNKDDVSYTAVVEHHSSELALSSPATGRTAKASPSSSSYCCIEAL